MFWICECRQNVLQRLVLLERLLIYLPTYSTTKKYSKHVFYHRPATP